MSTLQQYVSCVVSAALIGSILSGLTQKGAARELIRLLCGLFLTITVIRPLSSIDFDVLSVPVFSYVQEAESLSAAGESMAKEAMTDIIKSSSEAYILDKAAELNAEITVEVSVDKDQHPACAVLGGEVSPYVRRRLEDTLESDLGITKENQIWTG